MKKEKTISLTISKDDFDFLASIPINEDVTGIIGHILELCQDELKEE